MNKRVLVVAYNFPPLMSPQSLRWFYLSRELFRQGYAVDVLTIQMPERFCDLLDMIPEGIHLHRTFPGPFYYLTFKYSRESSDEKGPVYSAAPSSMWKVLSFTHDKIYRILYRYLFPDIQSEWFPFAVKKGLRLITMNKYDVIISSSEPRMCHLVGYFLKKKSGIPWIADYGDPWVYPSPILPESYLRRCMLRKIEEKILKGMDAITVVAEGIKKLYIERYPFLNNDKIYVITQGFDPEVFSQLKEETAVKFRIVYCGSFYKKLRDPMPFFEAIKEIENENVEVIIAGRINEYVVNIIKSEDPSAKIAYRGFLSHRKSLLLQKSASVLLHIGNAIETQVPGKIYEYLGAQKPILCIRSGDKDFSPELVTRYNKGIVVNNNKKEIKEGIMTLYNLWQNGLLDSQFNHDIVTDHTWQKSAEDINRIIRTL